MHWTRHGLHPLEFFCPVLTSISTSFNYLYSMSTSSHPFKQKICNMCHQHDVFHVLHPVQGWLYMMSWLTVDINLFIRLCWGGTSLSASLSFWLLDRDNAYNWTLIALCLHWQKSLLFICDFWQDVIITP